MAQVFELWVRDFNTIVEMLQNNMTYFCHIWKTIQSYLKEQYNRMIYDLNTLPIIATKNR